MTIPVPIQHYKFIVVMPISLIGKGIATFFCYMREAKDKDNGPQGYCHPFGRHLPSQWQRTAKRMAEVCHKYWQ